jgi:hypothetical protein
VEGAGAPLDAPRAIGRLEPDGPWIGFDHPGEEYRFVLGSGEETLVAPAPADADLLLALAIAHFAEAFGGAPPDLEATQADLSALVGHLMGRATDAGRRALLAEALDAIDDGLAGDAVATRLAMARGALNERVDPVELLLAQAEALLRGT